MAEGSEIQAGSAAEIAYRHIRHAIVTGELAPGAELKETQLATAIGVSRTPVREALSRLGSEGLVALERFRRGRVVQFSARETAEIFHLRALLEGHAAGRAATRITDAQIGELAAIEAEMEARFAELGWHRHLAQFDRLNNAFHALVASAADSPRLERVLASALELPASIFNTYREALEDRTRRTHRQHREIIDALRARDPATAEAAMRGHLLSLAPGGY
jgi:DNA-binding GntR family transcriptional regulator